MIFFVFPREIRKINKWERGRNKLRGVTKNHEKIKPPPVILNLRVSRLAMPFLSSLALLLQLPLVQTSRNYHLSPSTE